ncbi:S-adenosyl-L-methionine-dependent methyltransferase [Echria macrotheca]|uniref:S-adenosyl-L-methionine-dependent methyltransferase n=1 Tax=Echria macrotheca TaxID=438768 RepID=A0AAJ0B6W8_9PEZI|nr:S-adenosyl-L-methionine-dependent methyltransferase [Echria macrotheca]
MTDQKAPHPIGPREGEGVSAAAGPEGDDGGGVADRVDTGATGGPGGPDPEPERGHHKPDEKYDVEDEDDNDSAVGSDKDSVGAPPSAFSTGLSVDEQDDDSGVADVHRPSSSVSATSSIYEFREEFGRTYHSYHEGAYFFPNDIPEQERLDLQHSIAHRLFGKLALAPIDRPKRVIDLGTGTGIWAIEFATENPTSEVLGTDLSPIQPEYVPPNCHFEIDDGEDEWVFSHPFDYVHARFMCGGFRDFPRVFRSAFENMVPGGWIEFQDYYVKMQCVDDSLRGTALERWNDLLLDAVSRTGKSGLAAARFREQMLDAGFVDVVEKKFALPGNAWPKGRKQKMLGTMQMMNIMDGLHGISMGLFTKMLGWNEQEVEELIAQVSRDLRDKRIHFYYIVMSVYGRKPLA